MRLHENERLFKQAISVTAEMMGIPEIFIEKDYWVTYALHVIFNDEIGGQAVFKGGTALSKCFGLIERFSEDIDLVVRNNEGETNNQLTKKIRKIGKVVEAKLAEIEVEGLTRKMGMNRKTAHEYPVTFDGQFGQVRNTIIIEATWFGYYEPYAPQPLSSYIYDMMIKNNQKDMAEEYGMLPFEVNVLEPTRTLCEKIMSLVRFSYGENPINELRMKIRHIYDLHKMLEDSALHDFFRSDEFDTFICRVAQDDVQSFRNNNNWLINHPAAALVFKDVQVIWEQLKATYTGDFSGLVYGVLPDEADIAGTLILIKERLTGIKWQISLPEGGNE